MKIKDLKKLLENLDENLDVILQVDPEGNGYNMLRCYGLAFESKYKDYYDDSWSWRDAAYESEEEYEKFKEESPLVLILSP